MFLLSYYFGLIRRYYGSHVTIILRGFSRPLTNFNSIKARLNVSGIVSSLLVRVSAIHGRSGTQFPSLTFKLRTLPNSRLYRRGRHSHFTTTLHVPSGAISNIHVISRRGTVRTLFGHGVLLVSASLFRVIVMSSGITSRIRRPLQVRRQCRHAILFPSLSVQ